MYTCSFSTLIHVSVPYTHIHIYLFTTAGKYCLKALQKKCLKHQTQFGEKKVCSSIDTSKIYSQDCFNMNWTEIMYHIRVVTTRLFKSKNLSAI